MTPSGQAMPVDPGDTGTPFYFVPAHDWGTVGLGALGRRLDCGYALYTFQLDDDLRPESVSVGVVVAMLVGQLRAAQPIGPYALGGICFGGGIALEMARVLESEGEKVTLVLVNPIGERPGRLVHGLRSVRLNGAKRLAPPPARASRPTEPCEHGHTPSVPLGDQLERALKSASESYDARPYPGRITVLAGMDYTTPRRFWEGIAIGGLDWRRVPHGSAAVLPHAPPGCARGRARCRARRILRTHCKSRQGYLVSRHWLRAVLRCQPCR